MLRIASLANVLNALQHQLARYDDGSVRRGHEMFFSAILNFTGALGNADVLDLEDESYAAVALGFHGLSVLKIAIRFVSGWTVAFYQFDTSPALLVRIDRPFSIENDDVLPMMCIIDGHVPIHQITFFAVKLSRRSGEIRHDKVADAKIF